VLRCGGAVSNLALQNVLRCGGAVRNLALQNVLSCGGAVSNLALQNVLRCSGAVSILALWSVLNCRGGITGCQFIQKFIFTFYSKELSVGTISSPLFERSQHIVIHNRL
jgi:hypothetical protein